MSTIEVNTITPISGSSDVTLGGSSKNIKFASGTTVDFSTNTPTISGITQGVTTIDRWRVGTTFTNSLDPIVWSQNTDSDSPSLGTAMTHSSGIFTFPQTGFWLINAYATGATAASAGNTNYHVAFSTDSGSNYSQLCAGLQAVQTYQQFNIICLAFFDVTNISTHRLKVYINTPSGASVYGQNNGNNLTRIDFLRIGDT